MKISREKLYEDIGSLRLTHRKIPKISPSMYKPPEPVMKKTPLLNCPSKYKPPGGLYLENCPQIQSKTKLKWYIYFQL